MLLVHFLLLGSSKEFDKNQENLYGPNLPSYTEGRKLISIEDMAMLINSTPGY
jgi:hypothetical protein